ncbi:MAG TPA: succinate dehydrogenase, hydrophobic membrane anchor protein [Steroidobacter sp.]|jgi:succinate dehydrogenase / fumarate reductase membrane anchor subunit|nr:succinate dehydrogenase, hydrophobic membrane anchor protein [Steroidobacter sp.]
MSLRSPLGRVLGLGAAKEGPAHWWSQRVTAAALVVLTLWFVASLLRFNGFDYDALIAWAGAPVNSVLLILLTATLVYHSMLGLQVVIEDYVSGGLRVVTLIFVNFVHYLVAALAIFAVLRIAFGGAA